MDPAFFFAMIVGIGPALLAMYYILRGYVAALDERRLFLAFGIGLILGLVGFTFHVFLDPVVYPPSVIGFLVYVVGFAFLENLVLFVALNFKWVRGKPEAAFIGVSLGAGFSASAVMGLAYNQAAQANFLISPQGVLLIVCISLGSTLFRTAAGALLGIGSAKSEPWQWFGRAFGAQIPYGALMMGILLSVFYVVWYWAVIMLLLVAYALWVLLFVWRNSLPEFLPGELKRRLRRDRRRSPV
jgi:hypothetical protein